MYAVAFISSAGERKGDYQIFYINKRAYLVILAEGNGWGSKYDLTFYLGTFNHYDTLVKIMQRWREKGIDFTARSAFTDSYIREQEKRLN